MENKINTLFNFDDFAQDAGLDNCEIALVQRRKDGKTDYQLVIWPLDWKVFQQRRMVFTADSISGINDEVKRYLNLVGENF